jgi:zinc transport system substrate-binding protein
VGGPAVHHSHGTQTAHAHSGPDPHTWLDPLRYAQQAAAVADALVRHLPGQAEAFREAQTALQADLEQLDRDLLAALGCLQGRPLAANHPTWTYWKERGNLSLTVLSLEPGVAASPGALAPVRAWAQAAPEPVLLWEDEPGEALREALPGIHHLVLDPLEGAPAGAAYDYRAQAGDNVARVRALCRPDAGTPAP